MSELRVQLVKQPLAKLTELARDYQGMELELAIAYVSPGGVLSLSPLIRAANRTRITVGVTPINRVAALRQLQGWGAEVFIYLATRGTVFHPKVYYGTRNGQAWAMIGSSNLTVNGLDLNIELNLLVQGRRVSKLFTDLEAFLEAYRGQAHLLTEDLCQLLEDAGRRLGHQVKEREYADYLCRSGLQPAEQPTLLIPENIQRQALEELVSYLQETRMVYAYQMLLCLVMLTRADERGFFSQSEAAACFRRFYQLRDQAGLPRERQRGERRAAIDDPELGERAFIEIIRIDPFPRFERRGLLEMSSDGDYYSVNPALMKALTPEVRVQLRELAIQRLAQHYGEDRATIERLVTEAIG
ncbi:phospholipase D-like domain-containing protein [Thermogemmatispora sp.]|uniref:phospholipase D-like domain-containing protein n=1 Tax=Thermogemmatispora sp. TaxID=1968838 RepID=UPI0035E41D3F